MSGGLLALVLWLFLGPAACAPSGYLEAGRAPDEVELAALLARVVDRCGGAERLRGVSVRLTQDAYIAARGAGFSNRARREVLFRGDLMFRFRSEQAGQSEGQLLNREASYLGMSGSPLVLAEGASRQMVLWQYKSLQPACMLIRDNLESRGRVPVEIEGRTLVPVELKDDHKPPVTIYVDPVDAIIRRVEARLPITAINAQLKVSMTARQDHTGHREVDGVLWPFKVTSYSDDEKVALIDTVSIESVPDLPDDRFDLDATSKRPESDPGR